MTTMPTRKDEAFRYADIAALGEVWDALGTPERIEIAAQQELQQIWLPSGEAAPMKANSSSSRVGIAGLMPRTTPVVTDLRRFRAGLTEPVSGRVAP